MSGIDDAYLSRQAARLRVQVRLLEATGDRPDRAQVQRMLIADIAKIRADAVRGQLPLWME